MKDSGFWPVLIGRYVIDGRPASELVDVAAFEVAARREDRWEALIALRMESGLSLDLLVDLSWELDEAGFATFCRNARRRRERYGVEVVTPGPASLSTGASDSGVPAEAG